MPRPADINSIGRVHMKLSWNICATLDMWTSSWEFLASCTSLLLLLHSHNLSDIYVHPLSPPTTTVHVGDGRGKKVSAKSVFHSGKDEVEESGGVIDRFTRAARAVRGWARPRWEEHILYLSVVALAQTQSDTFIASVFNQMEPRYVLFKCHASRAGAVFYSMATSLHNKYLKDHFVFNLMTDFPAQIQMGKLGSSDGAP